MDLDVKHRLLEACENGLEAEVAEILDSENIHLADFEGEDGNPLLNYAAANGHENVVAVLLDRGSDFNLASMYGWTPLMQACAYGHMSVVSALLKAGADLNRVNSLGCSALICAARGGHTEVVQILLAANAQLEADPDSESTLTPLIAAAMGGHESSCRLLVDAGADVDAAQAGTGWTALMQAANNGYLAVAQVLVGAGCNLSKRNALEMTATDIAMEASQDALAKFLAKKSGTGTREKPRKALDIFEATKQGNYDAVRDLLNEDPALVNLRDNHSATCLMFAAMRGHVAIAELLVDRDAELDWQDDISQWTALMNATYYGHLSIVQLLIQSGADVTLTAQNGCTAFDIASLIGDTEIVHLLAAAGMRQPPKSNDSTFRTNRPPPASQRNNQTFTFKSDRSFKSLMRSQNRIFSPIAESDSGGTRSSNGRNGTGHAVKKPAVWRRGSSANSFASSHSVDPEPVSVEKTSSTTSDSGGWWSCCLPRRSKKNHRITPASPINRQDSGILIRAADPPVPPWRRASESRESDPESLVNTVDLPVIPPGQRRASAQEPPRFKNLNVGGPMNKLSAEVLVPIKPPFMPPPAFELVHIERPKFERPQRQSSDFSNIPAILKGPQLSRMRSSFLRPQDKHAFGGLPRKPVPKPVTPRQSVDKVQRVRFAPSPQRRQVTDTASDTASHADSEDRPRTADFQTPPISDRSGSTSPQLISALESRQLGHLIPVFEREEIDTDCFLTLTEPDLVELGISQPGTRKQVISLIEDIRPGEKVEPPSSRKLSPTRPRSHSVGANPSSPRPSGRNRVSSLDLDIGLPPAPPTSMPGIRKSSDRRPGESM